MLELLRFDRTIRNSQLFTTRFTRLKIAVDNGLHASNPRQSLIQITVLTRHREYVKEHELGTVQV